MSIKKIKKIIQKIKDHKGVRGKEFDEKDKLKVEAVTSIVLGFILVIVSGYLFFFKLQVFESSGLIKYFPGVYILLASLLISGCGFLMWGLIKFKK